MERPIDTQTICRTERGLKCKRSEQALVLREEAATAATHLSKVQRGKRNFARSKMGMNLSKSSKKKIAMSGQVGRIQKSLFFLERSISDEEHETWKEAASKKKIVTAELVTDVLNEDVFRGVHSDPLLHSIWMLKKVKRINLFVEEYDHRGFRVQWIRPTYKKKEYDENEVPLDIVIDAEEVH